MNRSTETQAPNPKNAAMRERRPKLLASVLLLALIMAPLLVSAADKSGLRITYLVYSGRQNPILIITDPALLRMIEARLQTSLAAPAKSVAAAEPILGYNGILIETIGNAADGVGAQAMVIKGRQLRIDSTATSVSASPTLRSSAGNADLEAILLKLGQREGALDAATLGMVLKTGG